jgi:hypothetical protein
MQEMEELLKEEQADFSPEEQIKFDRTRDDEIVRDWSCCGGLSHALRHLK